MFNVTWLCMGSILRVVDYDSLEYARAFMTVMAGASAPAVLEYRNAAGETVYERNTVADDSFLEAVKDKNSGCTVTYRKTTGERRERRYLNREVADSDYKEIARKGYPVYATENGAIVARSNC